MSEVLLSILPERLSEILQGAGYRVEAFQDENGNPALRSATGGLAFNIRFGNRAAPPAEGFLDFTLVAVLKLEGDFPTDRVNDWNRQTRFARLYRTSDFLVLEKDVMAAGGVRPDHLRAQIEIWDRLIQELILFLRNGGRRGEANAA